METTPNHVEPKNIIIAQDPVPPFDKSPPRRPSADEFDQYVAEFFMAFVEQDTDTVVNALLCLRHNLQTSELPNLDQLDIRREILANCETKATELHEKVLSELRTACQDARDDDALHYFGLADALGIGRKGAIALIGHLRQMFKRRSRAVVEHVKTNKISGLHGYADRQGHLEGLGEILTDVSRVMSAVFDMSASQREVILCPLHEEATEHALALIDIYAADARLSQWERKAVSYQQEQAQAISASRDQVSFSNLNLHQDQARLKEQQKAGLLAQQRTRNMESDASVQMMDLILDELAFIGEMCSRYNGYVSSMTGTGEEDLASKCCTKLQYKTIELGGVYVLLERFYIFQTVQKSIECAEPQELDPGVYVTSAVEDVCFIFDKVFARASRSLSYSSVLSMVMAIIDVFESIFVPAILNIPHETQMDSIPIPDLSLVTSAAKPSPEFSTCMCICSCIQMNICVFLILFMYSHIHVFYSYSNEYVNIIHVFK